MEGTGMSLFQGAASIHINNSAQDRLEEQEELEDQKRRTEELKHNLANAFDDLINDDDEASSVNSSGNFTMDATRTNGTHKPRPNLPTYVESLNHLKEVQHGSESPKPYCETPKSHHTPHMRQEEPIKLTFSPYGAGDGHNNYFNQEFTGQLNGINNFDTRQEYMNHEKLQVMYEMRVKECQQLAAQMQKQDMEIDSLRARLTAAVNDRDKVELSLQEAHHLLASSKHKLIELEQQITTLSQKLMDSEHDKEQLRLEVQSANLSLQQVQQRLHTMQITHSHDTDALFREQQDRHREEVDRLQNDLIKAKNRLDEKDNEVKILEKRCKEREREKEEILIEKGGTINRLAGELEAAQSRLVSGESTKLKDKVSQLTAERNMAREQVKELGSKLELTAQELVLCRQKLVHNQKEHESWYNTLQQILLESLPEGAFIGGDPPSPGRLATLKEVLSRYKQQTQKVSTLQEEINKRDKKLEQHRKQEFELRSKIEDHRGIEMQLNSRIAMLQNKLDLLGTNTDSELLESYRQQNEKLQADIEELRKEMKALDLKYTELELDYEKLKSEKSSRASMVQEANADLLRELDKYSAQLKDTLRENGELKNLYLQACSSRESVAREFKAYQTKIQKENEMYKSQEREHIERIEKEKQQVEKLTAEFTSSKEELEMANKRISELQKEFTDKQKEFADKLDKYLQEEKIAMRKEMEPCLQCEKLSKHIRHLDDQLSKCSIKLANQESNEALMKELKSKAEYFQQYIVERFRKLTEQRSVGTNTEHEYQRARSVGEVVEEDDDAIAIKTDLMMKENVIRDQIAEKFTLEIKTMEMNFTRRMKEVENEHQTAVTKLKELLDRKVQEVETLKQFILSERAKVTQILESKENEISILIKEHNQLQEEFQTAKDSESEWRVKVEKYKEKTNKLSSLEEALRNEKENLKKRITSSTKDWQLMKNKMTELQTRLTLIEQKYETLQTDHRTLQDKYKNVKKTVFTYKDYMAKKDAHVNNEMSRIQDEYRKIFIKLQNQIDYFVNCRMQEERVRGRKAQEQEYQQYNYADKLKKLNDDFARLAHTDFSDAANSNKP